MSTLENVGTSILAPDDTIILEESGLVSPPLSDGTRRIHKRRLTRSSDEEGLHLPLSPASIASDSFVSIPEHLISFATLQHLGYNSQTATRIWEYWTNWPAGEIKRESDDIEDGIPFIDVAKGHIYHSLDTCEDDDARWLHCMDSFWALDTLKLRYRGLQAIQEASRWCDMASRREASQASQPGHVRSVSSGEGSTSGSLGMVPRLSHEASLSHATNVPGYTTLYKGIDQALVDGLFDVHTKVQFGYLICRLPSDFSGREADIYLAVDREVAEYYAFYVNRRSVCSAAVIIHITIPNSVIDSLSPPDVQTIYWPSAEWKSLVFHCRRSTRLPPELRKYQLAKILIGTICGKPTSIFANMRSPDEITEQMVLKTRDGRNAIQYVFKGDDGDDLLEDISSVAVFPLTTLEFKKWYRTV
ncbi:unnamed protein product [Penicillium glandicola]